MLQAVLAQVALLEEAQQQLPPVDVPEHLNVPEVRGWACGWRLSSVGGTVGACCGWAQ
jgi:hypothetical protein